MATTENNGLFTYVDADGNKQLLYPITKMENVVGLEERLVEHETNKANPHGVTKSQVGLGNVPNVATNDQTPTFTAASTLATLTTGEKISVAFGKIAKAITDLISHIGNKSNPHGVTAAQAGAVPTSRKINGKALSGDITLTATEVSGMGGTPKKGSVVYSTIDEMGLGLTAPCTTDEFASTLPGYSNVQFMHRTDETIHLTDTPASYGTVEFHKGPNNSYVYGFMVDIYSNVYIYKYHSAQTATNGWKRLSSDTLWTNASPASSFNGQKITVNGMKYCKSIMIVLQAVNGCHIYHIAHRNASITHANTPTHARYDNGHYTVGRAVGVDFTNNTIEFGHGDQNGSRNQGVAVPIVVIALS